LREVLIISGKGGTGKTSLTAAFAHIARNHVICDLDVDAPDLHILSDPRHRSEDPFMSGNTAVITDACEDCGQCIDLCRFDAIQPHSPHPVIDELKCEGCKLCVAMCPVEAIAFPEKECGNWYISDTRFGPMVHAQLYPGEENSGRLVTLLKQHARKLAEASGKSLILADGPPGIGCPVIASVGGADEALLVAEPSLSAAHDLERAISLCNHFGVHASVCVNKQDLSIEMSRRIEGMVRDSGASYLGGIPFDPAVSDAQIEARTVVESGGPAAEAIESIWNAINQKGA